MVTVTGVTAGTSSTATITTTRTGYTGGSAPVTATSAVGAALTPTFGTPTPTADGFTVQINNYDAAYTWAGTATSGTVVVTDTGSGTGLVTVTGVTAGTSSTAMITTTRTGYPSGTAPVTATSVVGAALTPTFGTPTPTTNGFTVQINNYDPNFVYAGTVTAGFISISGTGLVTVIGVPPNTSSTVTITTSQTGFANGSSQVTATSLNAANIPSFIPPTPTANDFTVQISNYDPNFTYAGTATAGSVSISGTGLVTVTGVPPNTSSTATITTTQTGYATGSSTVTVTSVAPTPTPTPTPIPAPTPTPIGTPTAFLVTGTAPGSSGGFSTVNLYNPITGKPAGTAIPFPGFKGQLTVVSADLNADGFAEIIVGAGPGGGPAIAILNSQTGEVIGSFFAFDPAFRGGVFVAVQDDTGDGILRVIVGAGPGGGPEVRVFNGRSHELLQSFYAYVPTFTGGISVASIDFNHDGILDIVTGAGPGGGPHVKIFDGATNAVLNQWYAYPMAFTGGIFVAAGGINDNGSIEVVTGAGAGGAPVVAIWDPFTGKLISQFMAYAESFNGGVCVGINDGSSNLVTGAGPGGGPHVKAFSFPTLDLLFQFYSGNPTNTDGVYAA